MILISYISNSNIIDQYKKNAYEVHNLSTNRNANNIKLMFFFLFFYIRLKILFLTKTETKDGKHFIFKLSQARQHTKERVKKNCDWKIIGKAYEGPLVGEVKMFFLCSV